MPFFRHNYKVHILARHSESKMIWQTVTHQQKCLVKIAPLQVRNRINRMYGKRSVPGKRVSSWAFEANMVWRKERKRHLSTEAKGSLTLEAALVFPLFVFFCAILLIPMQLMDRQRQIQSVVESVGEDISQYAYGVYVMNKGKEKAVDLDRDDGESEDMSLFFKGAAEAYVRAAVLGRINGKWVRDVSFSGTEVGTDEMVRIVMKYRMLLPFSIFRTDSIEAEAVCSRRLWTGAGGNRGGADGGGTPEEEEMVYVGRDSTRYHRKRDCHYLYNDLKQVGAGEIEDLRNQDGKRYHPCSSCQAASFKGPFFVMPWGTRYHATGRCSSITAFVQTVPLSQVEHLGACSYCGGRK